MPGPDRLVLRPVRFDALPGWAGGSHWGAVGALRRSCVRLGRLSALSPVGPKAIGGTAGDWRAPCGNLHTVRPEDHAATRSFLERWFRPYRAVSERNGERGLFTGYFEPELQGARHRHGRFNVPIYRRPPEFAAIAGKKTGGALARLASRRQIVAGALSGRGLELAWVDSEVDAFFLHVQGSGRIRLRDGTVMRIGFAGGNGHPYTSIGKELIGRGEIPADRVTMQSIRDWLAAHPDAARSVMAVNASYVFFRELGSSGPIGAEGVALTPGRSLAVDRRHLPLGAPIWIDTMDPLDPGRKLQRMMVAQDTGSAIIGPVRGDIFWGHDKLAPRRAGNMKHRGRYFLLLPRTVRP